MGTQNELSSTDLFQAAGHNTLMIGLGWPYHIRFLAAADIPAMIELQKQGGDQVITKTAGDLESLFAHGDHAIGVIHQGQLVGQATLCHGTVAPGTLNQTFRQAIGADSDDLSRSVIGGVTIAQLVRGKGLMESLLKVAEQVAVGSGRQLLHAHVKTDNISSWRHFLGSAFNLTACGPSPSDGARTVYTLQKSLSGGNVIACEDSVLVSTGRPSLIKSYLNDGYIGTDLDRHTKALKMSRPSIPN